MEKVFELVNEMSPYLLLGFLLAGLMHAFVPNTLYSRYLSKNNISSVVYSALFGVPLPLCSCGVIPTAMSLHREGASKGATVSFLVSTPQTGVDSIIATYSLMGLPFAVVRPIAAFFTAIFAGQMVNFIDGDKVSVECSCNCNEQIQENLSFWQKITKALEYAFIEMMEDIGKWLVVGLIVAGLITILVPDSFFELFKDNSMLSILFVLLFSIPMYLCATGSIPIAVALMLKGLTPGAALVLLMAGPASNMASILVINKVLGKKTLCVYLASIIGGAILFALGIDYLFPREWFLPTLIVENNCCEEHSSWFSIGCTIVMCLLLLNAFTLRFRGHSHHHHHSHEDDCCKDIDSSSDLNVYHVSGMDCNHCRTNVEKAILSVEGVESASVILASGEATVKGTASKEAIRNAVESIGFKLE